MKNRKTEKTSELSEDHGHHPYRIVWIIPAELLRESMAFLRRCIIAVDLFGPEPKVLSTPRRQAPKKLDVPAEVRPTQITEECFCERGRAHFFLRAHPRSFGKYRRYVFLVFSFHKERTRARPLQRAPRKHGNSFKRNHCCNKCEKSPQMMKRPKSKTEPQTESFRKFAKSRATKSRTNARSRRTPSPQAEGRALHLASRKDFLFVVVILWVSVGVVEQFNHRNVHGRRELEKALPDDRDERESFVLPSFAHGERDVEQLGVI